MGIKFEIIHVVCVWMVMSSYTSAQSLTTISYDANGNRVRKQLVGSSPHPTVTANPEAVNAGQPIVLQATGCTSTVRWLPVNLTGSQISVTISTTTQFTALCQTPGCVANGFAKVEVPLIQCPTVSLTAAIIPEQAVKNGQPVTLYAFGCTGATVIWSNGQQGTPVTTRAYGSSNVYTATCRTAYCPSLGTAQVLVGGLTGCQTGDVLVTKQDGNWNDVNTWLCGRVPTLSDEVYLRHTVSLNGITGYAKTVTRGEGYLLYDNNGRLVLPQ